MGHQITAHLKPELFQPELFQPELFQPELCATALTNLVDSHAVPVRHFGIILEWQEWHHLAERLRSQEIPFVIPPYVRFQGEVGEQATLFIPDPVGNAVEFKAFRQDEQIFATDKV